MMTKKTGMSLLFWSLMGNQVLRYIIIIMVFPISKTGINGLTTTFQYDGFGRVKKIVTPEGHEINETLNWNTQPQTNPGIYYTYDQVPGRPDQKVFYDRLGRVLRSTTDGFQYQVQQDNEYNSDGTLYRTS